MARIRQVKPQMALDEDLAELSPWAQLLAVRILNHADDEGYFKAHPGLVKATCFPLVLAMDESSIASAMNELGEIGYLEFCIGSDGKRYGRVVTFGKHQRINRPRASEIKDLWTFTDASVKPHGGVVAVVSSEEQVVSSEETTLADDSADAELTGPDLWDHEFNDLLWPIYPERTNNPKKPARLKYRTLRRNGLEFEYLLERLKLYITYIEATGKKGTETILQAQTFFGPNERYADDFKIPMRPLRLPADDMKLEQFAKAKGLAKPGGERTYFEYRSKLKDEISAKGLMEPVA